MITQEYLCEIFEYKNGNLYWKIKSSFRTKIGDKVGSINGAGYCDTTIKGRRYLIHRLIFLMQKGYLPKQIDHIDGNRANNKIENLRIATIFQNSWNRKLSKNNKSGVKGVSWSSIEKKWRVQICLNGITKHLGAFDDIKIAKLIIKRAREKYHGNFANHG